MVTARKLKLQIIDGPEVLGRLAFVKLLAETFDVSILGCDPKAAQEYQDAAIPYSYVPLTRGLNVFKDIVFVYRLYRLIRTAKPDILHTFGSKTGIWGRLAGKLARVDLVSSTITGLGSTYVDQGRRRKVLKWMYSNALRLTLRWSPAVVFQNTRDHDELIVTNVVDGKKSTVISGSGVDTEKYSRSAVDSRSDTMPKVLPGHNSELVILMVTRIIRSKGVIEFAKVAAMADAKKWPAKFFIAGTIDTASIDRFSSQEISTIQKSVELLGQRSDVDRLLRRADIFVFPTMYREGIPRVVLEAASMGLPIITTDEGSGSGVAVRDGENGFVINPRNIDQFTDCVDRLVSSSELRMRFGTKSRMIAETELSVRIIAQRYETLFNSLAAIEQSK